MTKVFVSARARAELDEIWLYIARDSVPAAERLARRIAEAQARLADFPYSAPAREDLAPGLRAVVVGDVLILYRADTDAVRVMRYVHGARDLGGLLAEG